MTGSKYGCHNRPRPVAGKMLPVQDGWKTVSVNGGPMIFGPIGAKPIAGESIRVANMVESPFINSTECRYDASSTDSKCAGCEHVNANGIS